MALVQDKTCASRSMLGDTVKFREHLANHYSIFVILELEVALYIMHEHHVLLSLLSSSIFYTSLTILQAFKVISL
jgi:hypothetical protein